MQELKKEELKCCIGGGIAWNGTLISSLIRGVNIFVEIGRSLGTALRRWQNNTLCPI